MGLACTFYSVCLPISNVVNCTSNLDDCINRNNYALTFECRRAFEDACSVLSESLEHGT